MVKKGTSCPGRYSFCICKCYAWSWQISSFQERGVFPIIVFFLLVFLYTLTVYGFSCIFYKPSFLKYSSSSVPLNLLQRSWPLQVLHQMILRVKRRKWWLHQLTWSELLCLLNTSFVQYKEGTIEILFFCQHLCNELKIPKM